MTKKKKCKRHLPWVCVHEVNCITFVAVIKSRPRQISNLTMSDNFPGIKYHTTIHFIYFPINSLKIVIKKTKTSQMWTMMFGVSTSAGRTLGGRFRAVCLCKDRLLHWLTDCTSWLLGQQTSSVIMQPEMLHSGLSNCLCSLDWLMPPPLLLLSPSLSFTLRLSEAPVPLEILN